MKHLFFCFVFLFLLYHVSSIESSQTLKIGASVQYNNSNGNTCLTPITQLRVKNFSIAEIVSRHNAYSILLLEQWVVFFFSHFPNLESFIQFTHTVDKEKFIRSEIHCFRRAATLYLLTYYSRYIHSASAADFTKRIKKDLRTANSFVLDDFDELTALRNYSRLQDMFKFESYTSVGKSFISRVDLAKDITVKDDAAFVEILRDNIADAFYKGGFFKYFNTNPYTLPSFNKTVTIDFNWIMNVSYLSFYSKSDLTFVDFVKLENNRKKKLGMRYRSTKFDLTIPEEFTTKLKYFNETDEILLDDLVQMYFSVIKYKMVKGNEALISDLNESKEKGSYLLTNLKGLRKVKYFFKRKNAKSIFDMNLNLVSTELKFLTEDFLYAFEESSKALATGNTFYPSDVYLLYRGVQF